MTGKGKGYLRMRKVEDRKVKMKGEMVSRVSGRAKGRERREGKRNQAGRKK